MVSNIQSLSQFKRLALMFGVAALPLCTAAPAFARDDAAGTGEAAAAPFDVPRENEEKRQQRRDRGDGE